MHACRSGGVLETGVIADTSHEWSFQDTLLHAHAPSLALPAPAVQYPFPTPRQHAIGSCATSSSTWSWCAETLSRLYTTTHPPKICARCDAYASGTRHAMSSPDPNHYTSLGRGGGQHSRGKSVAKLFTRAHAGVGVGAGVSV